MSAAGDGPSRAATGLVIGRFDPPHLGHSFLIEQAAARCDQLAVYVNSSTVRDAAPGDLRAAWLADLHPGVRVIEVVHDLPTDWGDEGLWLRWIELFQRHWPFATGPDLVCSSDPYVAELARRLGAEPVVVDADRVNVPISATRIRDDPAAHLAMLAPPVRAWVEQHWVDGR
ncbi:MAG: adenylyltransferase/cytidyltransferase family protein [Ilumatobacteraceae bacterium]